MAGPITLPSGLPKWPPTWGNSGDAGCCCDGACVICEGNTPSNVTLTISGVVAAPSSILWYPAQTGSFPRAGTFLDINGDYTLPLTITAGFEGACSPLIGCHYEGVFLLDSHRGTHLYLRLAYRPRSSFAGSELLSRQFHLSLFTASDALGQPGSSNGDYPGATLVFGSPLYTPGKRNTSWPDNTGIDVIERTADCGDEGDYDLCAVWKPYCQGEDPTYGGCNSVPTQFCTENETILDTEADCLTDNRYTVEPFYWIPRPLGITLCATDEEGNVPDLCPDEPSSIFPGQEYDCREVIVYHKVNLVNGGCDFISNGSGCADTNDPTSCDTEDVFTGYRCGSASATLTASAGITYCPQDPEIPLISFTTFALDITDMQIAVAP